VILWTGEKHSGKTTALLALARRAQAAGYRVAGIAAPALWERGELLGFDLVDLASGERRPLLRRRRNGPDRVGPFGFDAAGLAAGGAALAEAARHPADLAVVDEFGPAELQGGGWCEPVEALLRAECAALLLVVRREILADVQALWPNATIHVVEASAADAVDRVLSILAAASSP